MLALPCGPVVKNLPCNAGDMGLIPGEGTKMPHARKQLGLRAITGVCAPQQTMQPRSDSSAPQPESLLKCYCHSAYSK